MVLMLISVMISDIAFAFDVILKNIFIIVDKLNEVKVFCSGRERGKREKPKIVS